MYHAHNKLQRVFFSNHFIYKCTTDFLSLFSYCAATFRFNTIESNKFIDDDDDDKASSDSISLASAVIGMFPCIIA